MKLTEWQNVDIVTSMRSCPPHADFIAVPFYAFKPFEGTS